MAAKRVTKAPHAFDVNAFLASAGLSRRVIAAGAGNRGVRPGRRANTVFYIQDGTVKLSVMSAAGKEAVVAMLGPGDFFGEGCLAGQPRRMGSATAITATTVLRIAKREMMRTLHEQHDAVRSLHRAHAGAQHPHRRGPRRSAVQLEREAPRAHAAAAGPLRRSTTPSSGRLPKLSQETLAEMVGTTRSRVNFFMNKFRKLGFIEYNGGIKINNSLLSVVLHD